ncbi:MAG: hypothetical protein ACRDZ5_01900 [Acidimicrobiales bacterium]
MTEVALGRRLEVVTGTLRQMLTGPLRVGWLYPGMDLIVVAYVATACGLIGVSYEHLWGVVAATFAGLGWYLSPLGRLEAKRRAHKRSSEA